MMDRGEFFVDGVPESGYLWCRECERAYQYGSYKEKVYRLPEQFPIELRTGFFYLGITPSDLKDIDDSRLQMCPYPGCGGDTVFDAFEWEWLRSYHPEYPEIPEDGVVYRL
jgi:hypothetical protein